MGLKFIFSVVSVQSDENLVVGPDIRNEFGIRENRRIVRNLGNIIFLYKVFFKRRVYFNNIRTVINIPATNKTYSAIIAWNKLILYGKIMVCCSTISVG